MRRAVVRLAAVGRLTPPSYMHRARRASSGRVDGFAVRRAPRSDRARDTVTTRVTGARESEITLVMLPHLQRISHEADAATDRTLTASDLRGLRLSVAGSVSYVADVGSPLSAHQHGEPGKPTLIIELPTAAHPRPVAPCSRPVQK